MSLPLHAHSYFSLGRGTLSPEDICRLARERGAAAVGMTDTANLYGLVRFLTAARREGVKPVVGAVLGDPAGRDLVTAYVLDRRGFGRLAELLSRLPVQPPGTAVPPALGVAPAPASAAHGSAGTSASLPPAVPARNLRTDLLEGGWEGLALACGDASLLAQLAGRQREAGGTAVLGGTGAPGYGPLYARLEYGLPFAELARAARALRVPPLAVNDAWYVEEEGAALGDLLAAMRRLCRLEDLPRDARLAPRHRWAGAGEMASFFSAVPEALVNARSLAEQADAGGILSERYIFPAFAGLSEEEAFRRLRARCEQGLARRYGEPPSPGCRARLAHELGIIRAKGFAGYFLVVEDIVAQCPRTCGRGSAAASIVSYLLGITHVDPLAYNLFFERFLNLDRRDPPDIDVDFPWDEREKALRYVFARYPAHSAMVADHVTFGPRSCLREPAKALGLPEEEIARLVRFWRRGENGRIPAYLVEAAERIRGFPRHLGTHPGGVVITPGPITFYTQVQESPLGYPVIAWEKDAAEEAGLVKIDLLGNRSLGVLRDSLALVNRTRGAGPLRQAELTWEGREALRDAPTRELIAAGRTLGIFYVESPATRQLLAKMGTGDYERLVIASSIIRPAANRWIREFVQRLRGAPYEPLTPRLEKTLEETFGIMVYQEDVSRVVIDAAGFAPGEADQLRKILSKKDRARRLPDFRERFFRGGAERGVPPAVLERVWDMILSFEGYSFCKAHSASYALVSYKLAYLKCYYPLEFFTAVINNGGGFYTRQTYVNEVRRLGFPVLPPDVNSSELAYTAEGGRALRVGLGQLRDLPLEFLQRLLADRERRGPFADFSDFLARLAPGLAEIRVLVRSGALDGIAAGLTRPALFWLYFRSDREAGQLLPPPVPTGIGDYPGGVKLLDELATLGLMISRHPVEVFRARIQRRIRAERALAGTRGGPAPGSGAAPRAAHLRPAPLPPRIDSRQLADARGRRVTLAGLLVTGKEVLTRRREPMVFVSFEDEYSVFETVFFPRVFRTFRPLIDEGGVFLVSGRVEDELGALSLHVDRVLRLDRPVGSSPVAAVSGGVWTFP